MSDRHLHGRFQPLWTLILAAGLTALLAGTAVGAPPSCEGPNPTHPKCAGEAPEHPGLTCAEAYAELPGIAHEWDGEGSYELDLAPNLPSACIDVRNGGPIALSVSITDTSNGKILSYNVADSRPGDDCTPWVAVDLTEPFEPFEHALPAATVNACTPGTEGDFTDSDAALAVYMNASFRGRPAGAEVNVTLTATPNG